jgi:hypothetical protein
MMRRRTIPHGLSGFSLFLAASCLFLLSACAEKRQAARVDETATPYQTLTVNTPGEEAVSCVLQSGDETYTMRAPGEVTLRRSASPMTVSCFKGAHMRGYQHVRATYAPREAQTARANNTACYTCSYPGTITVPIGINADSLEVNVRQGP